MKIWGNGGIRIQDAAEDYDIDFKHANCTLKYVQLATINTTIDGTMHVTNIKFRPVITAEIHICNNDLFINYLILLAILNNSWLSVGHLLYTVYPRYSDLNTLIIYYSCVLTTKDILWLSYAAARIGQSITLLFTAIDTQYIPYFTSDISVFNMVDADGNQYVDASDDKYIMQI